MKWRVLTAVLCMLFVGCSGALDFKIRFDSVEGLEKDSRVVFDKNPIGSVTEVSYAKEGYFLVSVVVEKDFAAAVTEHSRFFIASDPDRTGKKAVEMIRIKPGGAGIAPGSIVQGVTKSSALMEQMAGKLENRMDDLGKSIKEFSEGIGKGPKSDAEKELKSRWDRMIDAIQDFFKTIREKVENEVIPKINEIIDMFRNLMEDSKPEKDAAPQKASMNV